MWEINKDKKIQDDIFHLIDKLYDSNIQLNENFNIRSNSLYSYNVEIILENSSIIFTTSLDGIWGIPDNQEDSLEKILSIIKQEIRNINIDNILNK